MGALKPEEHQRRIDVIEECLAEGFPMEYVGGRSAKTALGEAARRLGMAPTTLQSGLNKAAHDFGLRPDPGKFAGKPAFTLDDMPHDGEPSAEELIAHLSARHRQRKIHEEAGKLRQVQITMDGPIAVAFFGDPHVDDPGCAWGDLERDVAICRDTPGMLAVDVGDDSNNWVGRLMRLYANQETTAKQSLKLIEWLMTQLPWLLRIKGNHDEWHTDKGDPADYIHRLAGSIGAIEGSGARMQLNLPSGASFTMHVRHDFPGGSQFNPAHAMVRETLFGYRDHVLACGHRHTSGYIPVWHNDPRRLCHGLRLGTYKDFDHYAREKGFQDGNWARSMAVIVDPAHAHDPVRFIKTFFSLEEAAEHLTWLRSRHARGKAA